MLEWLRLRDWCVLLQPLPIRAAADMFALLAEPQYADMALYVSCFEIYGGKLFDLLNARKGLVTREDGRRRICIVGLKEYEVRLHQTPPPLPGGTFVALTVSL